MGVAGDDEGDLVAHVSLPIADDTELMGSDVRRAQAERFRVGDNVQNHLAATDTAEAPRVFEALESAATG